MMLCRLSLMLEIDGWNFLFFTSFWSGSCTFWLVRLLYMFSFIWKNRYISVFLEFRMNKWVFFYFKLLDKCQTKPYNIVHIPSYHQKMALCVHSTISLVFETISRSLKENWLVFECTKFTIRYLTVASYGEHVFRLQTFGNDQNN